jgi:hypothetical protein
VTIRRGTGGSLRSDDSAGAGPVLHDHGPLELVLQFLRQHAGENVGAAAGGERADEGDGALRVIVDGGLRGRWSGRQQA